MAEKHELAILLTAKDGASGVLKQVQGNVASFDKTAGMADKAVGNLGLGMVKSALMATGYGAAIAVGVGVVGSFAGEAVKAASSVNESMNKVDVVFGTSSDRIKAFAKTASDSIGQSQGQVLEAAGTFGNLFTAMGIGQERSADMSTSLVALASDLASFNNIEPTEALDKLRSGLVGETEPLRSLGVNLSAATIEAKAMEMGLLDANGEVGAAQKAQASYALILEQTKSAQGDFARTSTGMANSQRTLNSKMAELQDTVGQSLIPVMETLIPIAVDMARVLGDVLPTALAIAKPVLDAVLLPMQGVAKAVTFMHDALATSSTAPGIQATAANVDKALKPIPLAVENVGNVVPKKIREAQEKVAAETAQLTAEAGDKLREIAEGEAKGIAKAQADGAEKIAEARRDAAEKMLDVQDDVAKRLTEAEKNYATENAKAVQDAGDRIVQAQIDAQKAIDDAIASLSESRDERAKRDQFQAQQEAARRARQIAKEEAEAELELKRDLESAKTAAERKSIQDRAAVATAERARKRKLDDDDRAFDKAQAAASRAFDDRLADAALKKRIATIQAETEIKVNEQIKGDNAKFRAMSAGLEQEKAKILSSGDEKAVAIRKSLDRQVEDTQASIAKQIKAEVEGAREAGDKVRAELEKRIAQLEKGLADEMAKSVKTATNTVAFDPSVPAAAAGIGRAVSSGVASGMKSGESRGFLLDAASSVISTIEGALRAAGIIHSPSQLMADRVGVPLAQGVVAGFSSGMDSGNSAIESSIRYLMDHVTAVALEETRDLADNVFETITDLGLGNRDFGQALAKQIHGSDQASILRAVDAAVKAMGTEMFFEDGSWKKDPSFQKYLADVRKFGDISPTGFGPSDYVFGTLPDAERRKWEDEARRALTPQSPTASTVAGKGSGIAITIDMRGSTIYGAQDLDERIVRSIHTAVGRGALSTTVLGVGAGAN